MKILSVSVQNFASYKSLEFDFNQGLCLIQGPTGSGKSTLCDVIPWILFGKTAKGGTVDEIRSWNNQGPTVGAIRIGNDTTIYRSRHPNDLYYTNSSSVQNRGRDLPDTQRIINNLIGIDYDLYLAGAYYHEFSQTAQFFTTTAKNRRSICEQLVDLTLAKKLQLKLSEEASTKTKELTSIKASLDTISSNIQLLKSMETAEVLKAAQWEKNHQISKNQAMGNYERFEKNRKKTITNECRSCGTVLAKPKEVIDTSENPYSELILDLEQAVNPHQGGVKDYSGTINCKTAEKDGLELNYRNTSSSLSDIELLKTVVNDYRSASIQNTIKDIETVTNQLLTNHFDSEIQISFDVTEADKLEVSIAKDGNAASYTQLSKGQRCILKLCFGVAVMKAVANHHGIDFHQIFFDESLDGMSTEIKMKAFSLFETLSLEYKNIFVVEHSTEFKSAFTNSYHVELINGNSHLEAQ